MNVEDKNETFTYTYSSSRQAEVKRIREKYLPKEEDKMERLRRLDESATRPGRIAALTVGIAGTLVMGLGMCCTMVWAGQWFIPGILIGVAGILGVMSAYPLYSRVTKKRREKIAPEILRLTDELMK